MNSVAPKTAKGMLASPVPTSAMEAAATTSVAATTAMPAPCGVGMRWEDRAFGFASATRSSSGRIADVMTPDSNPAAAAAANVSSSCELAMTRRE